ncbi:rhodanese-like domain-containing protein [Geodermatophilus sp. SYSU D00691]
MTRSLSRPAGARSIDELLADARSRLVRVTPAEAAARVARGALLVDIRPAAQRALEGQVPGSLVVERNVLEWRFDPASDARLPEATGYDVEVIVLCSEGYTSSLAADALRSLGLSRATDVAGGFRAWEAAGLPTRTEGVTRAAGGSPVGVIDAPAQRLLGSART